MLLGCSVGRRGQLAPWRRSEASRPRRCEVGDAAEDGEQRADDQLPYLGVHLDRPPDRVRDVVAGRVGGRAGVDRLQAARARPDVVGDTIDAVRLPVALLG